MAESPKTLLLIDGNNLFYRAYHALPPLTDKTGENANAVFGFSNMILRATKEIEPTYIACAFDTKAPTFRHVEFEAYKAQRKPPPDDLYPQLPKVKSMLDAFGICYFEKEGYEADDIIATIVSKLAERKDVEVLIASGDFDVFQVVSDRAKILYPEKGFRESKIFGEKEIMEKYGITPGQIPDFKGLCGDSSDNIKGVPGIGEKGARALIEAYGSIEKIYEALVKTPEKFAQGVRKKLSEGRESAFFSKRLATLVYDVPLNFSLKDFEISKLDPQKTVPVFEKFGFHNLMKRLSLVKEEHGKKKIAESQIALF